jgi:hypothetical protein
MTDQISIMPFEGGLNETSADVLMRPGQLRHSCNYSVRAQGGYEWIQGALHWSGVSGKLRYEALAFVEVDGVSDRAKSSIHEAADGVLYKYIGEVALDSSTLVVVEKRIATEDFPGSGELFNVDHSDVIITGDYSITTTMLSNITTILANYVSTTNAFPGTGGQIHLLKNITRATNIGTYGYAKVMAAVQVISNTAYMRFAQDDFAGWNGTQTLAVPADKTGMRWDAYVYSWDTTVLGAYRNVIFLVNGISPPQAIGITDGGFPQGAWTEINDTITEIPTNVIVHQNRLFLGYPGGRVLYSVLSDPTDFGTGAGEFLAGADITGFQVLPGDSLGIFCKDRIRILNGTVGGSDWEMTDYSDQAGAIQGSVQNMPTCIFCDKRGVTTLSASDTYGNFANNALTQSLPKLFAKITHNTEIYTAVTRSRSQYRIFNEKGHGLYLTFANGEFVGAMEVDLGMPVTAVGVLDTDDDIVLIASNDEVYQLDSGSTMNGTAVTSFLDFVDYPFQSPRTKKRFSQVDIDVVGAFNDTALDLLTRVNGAKDFHSDNDAETMVILGDTPSGSGTLDINSWSQRMEATAYTQGVGISQSMKITNQGTLPHVLNAAVVHYRPRGQKR